MGPTTDLFRTEMDNLLSHQRQQEIIEVVERLKAFKPTKLAVEVEKKKDEELNEKYKQYLAGEYTLEVNEVDQLGFRIAAGLRHEQVYGIDWMERGAGKRGAGDVYEWAKTNQPELFESIYGWLHHDKEHSKSRYTSILDMYRNCNDPAGIKQHHFTNINMARIKTAEEYVGMDWLIWWYQRNLIMFANLSDLVTSSEDRILFIVGGGHVEIISNFLKESELFELEPAQKYLY